MTPESQDQVPGEVERFILLAVPSVPFLEALLLVRSDPALEWAAPQLARALYLQENQAHAVIGQLHAAGIATINAHGAVRYAPQTDALRAIIERLADIYPRNLIGVSKLIHSRTHATTAEPAGASDPGK